MHSFTLTDRARTFLETGRTLFRHSHRGLRVAELPLDLIIALNGAIKRNEEAQVPFAVLDIAYRKEQEIERQLGHRIFNQSRELFLEMLRQILPDGAKVGKGRGYDFALISRSSPAELTSKLAAIAEQATDQLKVDLGVEIDVFGPKDFA